MKRSFLLSIAYLLLSLAAGALPTAAKKSIASQSADLTGALRKTPISFTTNAGQWDKSVLFRAEVSGATVWITRDGMVQQFLRPAPHETAKPHDPAGIPEATLDQREQLIVRTKLVGSREPAAIFGIEEQAHRSHFYYGSNPADWQTDIASYAAVYFAHVYDGIDLKFFGTRGELEYDFVVAPGADISQIELTCEGADQIEVGTNGDLRIATPFGTLIEQAPVIFQTVNGKRVQVRGTFEKRSANSYGFHLESSYDRSQVLVIDPVISYSSFLGGSASDGALAMFVNTGGEAYVAGYTASSNFPFSTGTFDSTYGGSSANDCFVSKFSATGNSLVYSTYIGGSALDLAAGIAVDASGNAFVTGYTESADFPTASSFDNSSNGLWDCFALKLSPTGNSLTYSTYLGGSSRDRGASIAVNSSGLATIAGFTQSTNYPTVAASYDTSANGSWDAFVTRLAANGSSLSFSTYLGGSGDDFGYELALDTGGLPIVVGYTTSTAFPLVAAQQGTFGGGTIDGFMTKLNAAGTALSFSTYVGGSDADWAEGVCIDKTNRIYLTGITASSDFPTLNPYDNSYNGGNGDFFVRRYAATGTTLLYSTFLGGTDFDRGQAIDIDDSNRVMVAGVTSSTDFPALAALDFTSNGLSDVALAQLDSSGTTLTLGSYIGGTGDDVAYGVYVEPTGLNFYVTGSTNSSAYPTFSGLPAGYGGLTDAFVTKISSFPDGDGDGIDDFIDNCTSVANPTQANADGDSFGDACDLCTDTDGDGFGNPGFSANTCPVDNCPTTSNVSQANADGDALGDICDACPNDPFNDIDGDGICGNIDNCPTRFNPLQEDSNFDGIGDSCSNTAVGTNIVVNLGSGVTVTFPTVTTAGLTELTIQSTGPAAPSTFGIIPLTSPKYYTITSTAVYTGSPTVSIVYNQGDVVGLESALTMQRHISSWTNITTSLNTTTNTIQGQTATFGVIGIGGVCCSGTTGNVNCDTGNVVDISDLTTLVDFLFITQTPLCCSKEANTDGSVNGFIDLSDLLQIVDFLFLSGAPLANCL